MGLAEGLFHGLCSCGSKDSGSSLAEGGHWRSNHRILGSSVDHECHSLAPFYFNGGLLGAGSGRARSLSVQACPCPASKSLFIGFFSVAAGPQGFSSAGALIPPVPLLLTEGALILCQGGSGLSPCGWPVSFYFRFAPFIQGAAKRLTFLFICLSASLSA